MCLYSLNICLIIYIYIICLHDSCILKSSLSMPSIRVEKTLRGLAALKRYFLKVSVLLCSEDPSLKMSQTQFHS